MVKTVSQQCRSHSRLRQLSSHLQGPQQQVAVGSAAAQQQAPLLMKLQSRGADGEAKTASEAWLPRATAIIVCDMWNLHPCYNAARRGAELCPTMERLLCALRSRGATVIHAPSGCMGAYSGTAARVRAQATPPCPSPPPGINEWQFNSAGEPCGLGSGPRDRQGPNAEANGAVGGYPVDQRNDTGAIGDDTPLEHAAWTKALQQTGLYPETGYGVDPISHQTQALTINHAVDYIRCGGRCVLSKPTGPRPSDRSPYPEIFGVCRGQQSCSAQPILLWALVGSRRCAEFGGRCD
jgi:hypothetical protein